MSDNCDICHGTRQINCLNVWKIQRRLRVNGGDMTEAVKIDLPFIVLDDACPNCCGEEAFERAHMELQERMGGNPWSADTYDGIGEA